MKATYVWLPLSARHSKAHLRPSSLSHRCSAAQKWCVRLTRTLAWGTACSKRAIALGRSVFSCPALWDCLVLGRESSNIEDTRQPNSFPPAFLPLSNCGSRDEDGVGGEGLFPWHRQAGQQTTLTAMCLFDTRNCEWLKPLFGE
eukprot:1389044-Rhodomonas_salina.1